MRLHILGIGGTFMSGVAILAKQLGHEVSGSDLHVYPPMSTQLIEQAIPVMQGYLPEHIAPDTDCVIVGNVIKRGNPAMEYILNQRMAYTSGPEWLAGHILHKRHVFAVAGTHGKTTTTSLLTWILYAAGHDIGFLIGGIPENFGVSAKLGNSRYFVIEADEYDSAFFDKRSKFIHYRPNTLILNNLEYDHADIFPDLAAIEQQFHFLIRTVPSNGCLIYQKHDQALLSVIQQGCFTPTITFNSKDGEWRAVLEKADGSVFTVYHHERVLGCVSWDLLGLHNVNNALAAIAAATRAEVPAQVALQALASFKNVKRRLEVKGTVRGITIYDDFAHHPTAIAATLAGLKAKIGAARLIAVLEFGSYTMRSGVHKDKLQQSLVLADQVVCKATTQDWGLRDTLKQFQQATAVYENVDDLVHGLAPTLQAGDHVVVMSNSGFEGIHQKLLTAIGL